MHPLLERCLWVRDRDLKRWGKPVAVILVLVGLLCFGGSITIHRMAGKLRDSLEENHQFDVKLAEALPEAKAKSAITKSFGENHEISLEMTTVLETCGLWIIGGAGLMALSSAAYAWRAAELASKLSDCPDSKPRS